jgi:hypothetical protein
LAFEWGQHLAQAREKRRNCEKTLKRVKGEVSLIIRKSPGEWGCKITEDSIKTLIDTDPAVLDATDELIQAQTDEETIESFVWALVARKDMIETMVSLYGQQYWSRPNLSQEGIRSMQHARQDEAIVEPYPRPNTRKGSK